MHLSWIALSMTMAGGLLFASPSPSTSTYVQCVDGCNRANLSTDDRATCKLRCDHAEKARIRDSQPSQPSHSPTATGAPHVTGAPSTPPAHTAALCRAQCSHEAPADRATCELNCKASASPRPDPSSATTVHSGPTSYTGSTTYPHDPYAGATGNQWPSGPTHGAVPGYGYERPQETAAQAAERMQCEANCERPGISTTDRETCKLNCDAVGWVQSQPMQRRIISDRPLTQEELNAMQRTGVIQNSPNSAGAHYPSAGSTYTYPSPGTGPSTTTRKTTDPAVLQRCASAWYQCDSSCTTPEASCLHSCSGITSSTDKATCELNCTNVRDSCKDRCNAKRSSCESVPLR